MAEVARHGATIELGAETRQGRQGLQLGSECKDLAHPAVVERLLTEAVTHQVELPLSLVPEGDGEHSLAGLERSIDPPAFDGRHQDLGVGAASERCTRLLQAMPDLEMVVDLSVVGHDPPATETRSSAGIRRLRDR